MTQDNVLPTKKWEFDAEVATCFDDMLRRSIPQHDVMRELVARIAVRKMRAAPGMTLLDLGCSRGEVIETVRRALPPTARPRFIGVEVSEPMLRECHARFGAAVGDAVTLLHMDLRTSFPKTVADVVASVLCLQFTPIEYRMRLTRQMYEATATGGCLILVEKVLGNCHEVDELMVAEYYDEKRSHGYTEEQIQRKRLALEGVLVPVTAEWNEHLLKAAGFRAVDCFWRWMNFAGWVALK